jgi:hypothetical protein
VRGVEYWDPKKGFEHYFMGNDKVATEVDRLWTEQRRIDYLSSLGRRPEEDDSHILRSYYED